MVVAARRPLLELDDNDRVVGFEDEYRGNK